MTNFDRLKKMNVRQFAANFIYEELTDNLYEDELITLFHNVLTGDSFVIYSEAVESVIDYLKSES